MSGSFRKAKGQRPAACSAPRGASRGCSAGDEAGQGEAGRLSGPGAPRPGPALTRKAGQRRPRPRRPTRPCHVLLHASWRPAFGGWRARHPDWRPGWGRTEESLVRQRAAAAGGVRRPRAGHSPGLQSEQRHRSLLRHGPRWPALATGSGVQCPASLPPARGSPPLSAPGSPPHEFSLTLPRPPRLIWFSPVPLAPLDAVLSVMPAPGAARCGRGVARDPAPSPHGRRAAVPRGGGASSGWARAASLLPESLSPGPEAAAASRWCPAAGLPAHCAFGLALLPSRLRAGPGGPAGAAPEPSAK